MTATVAIVVAIAVVIAVFDERTRMPMDSSGLRCLRPLVFHHLDQILQLLVLVLVVLVLVVHMCWDHL